MHVFSLDSLRTLKVFSLPRRLEKAPSPRWETVLLRSLHTIFLHSLRAFYFFFAAAAACLARYFASSGLPRQSDSATGVQQAA